MKEYVSPSMLFVDIEADIDTVSVSNDGDGIIVDLGGLLGGSQSQTIIIKTQRGCCNPQQPRFL